jgi:iron complex transport system substrate-binding protein
MAKKMWVAQLALLGALVAALGWATTAAPSAPPPRDSFPVTVEAANGKVRIAQRPKRIVSLSPTATETLFAIGAGRQVVAVDSLSNYPARAPRTSLSAFRPNAEAIAGYRPDLVILSANSAGIVQALRRLRIPVLLQPAARTLGEAYGQIRQLGRATGHRAPSTALVRRMRTRIAAALRRTPKPRTSLSIYHELTTDYYSATSKTFIGQLYRSFGLHNIADAAGSAVTDYPKLAGEYVIAANPDIIFLANTKCCGQRLATVRERPGWRNIRAVQRGRVVGLDDDIASRWGPRVVSLYVRVAASVRAAQR